MTSINQAMDRLLHTPITDQSGKFTLEWHRWFRDIDAKVRPVLTILGQISSTTTVQGQPGTLAEKTQNINIAGKVTASGVGFTVDAVPDGVARLAVVPNEKAGAGRAFNALDVNSRLSATSRMTMNNAACTPVGGVHPLSATSGLSVNHATVSVASFSMQFPFGVLNYNSGSITPLNDSTQYFIVASDPTFGGGAVVYSASVSNPTVTSAEGNVYIGLITTPAFGGGGTSGSGGGGGPCFSPGTMIRTDLGCKPISRLIVGDSVITMRGPRKIQAVLIHKYAGMMHKMEDGGYVTPEHRIWYNEKWIPAKKIWSDTRVFEGDVLNLHVSPVGQDLDDSQHNYLLGCGRYAHNLRKF